MSNWKLRVDGSWHDVSGVMQQISSRCLKAVYYEHPATSGKCVHVHGLIWGYTQKEDTLRNKCKSVSKGSYEASQNQRKKGPPVDEKFISYMSKGKYDPKFVKGWNEEEIESYKSDGYDKLDYLVAGQKVHGFSDISGAFVSNIIYSGKSKTKQTSEEKMNAWLVQECSWELGNQFTINKLQAKSSVGKTACQLIMNQVIRPQVIAYACGRVHNQQLIAMVRNAFWNFADEEVRELIKENIGHELIFS